ncbi:hypothetical protein GCM10007036_21250 [Alsobacter metallidurans]|uniref:HTH luxR-type domain-containing protein n=1 Tax=Alsobacter metallidurans TaxID=340221 RepID=A0A917I676_9HYPH|nr:LuxR C-terminal-related transcriptional regulator [Alsobacter metallidurans]GGH18822.1 hypothetical protein GCM10007036_21250 [Alsobacter metallidurans]
MSEVLDFANRQLHEDNGARQAAFAFDSLIDPSPQLTLSFELQALEKTLRAALIVVDEQGTIRGLTKRAGALLVGRLGFDLRDGRLRLERASLQRRFVELLATMRTVDPDAPLTVLGVPDSDGRVRYALKVMPLAGLNGGGAALLAISDLLNENNVARRTVATLFGLSEREAELADYFSRGLRIDEIAREMGVTPNTARVHLRSVFNKSGCSSQVELARLIAFIP